ncbi:MAG: hypothetical protein MJ176_04940 [Treponema sp.]|nr:hypothetical protein [Treponema sp.]
METYFYDEDKIFFTLTKEERVRYQELNAKGCFKGVTEEEKKELIYLHDKGMKPYYDALAREK